MLKILILEDSISDSKLIQRLVSKEIPHCEFNLAMDKKSFLLALDNFSPDIILSDNSLPQFNSSEAMKISRKRIPHIPFILVTGTVSEEFAVSIIKLGADDYILKDRLQRLPAAIKAAMEQRRARTERLEADKNLKSLEEIIVEQRIQEQKKITRAIIVAEDNERSHMGRELHDNINQILAAAKLYLNYAGSEKAEMEEVVSYPIELIEKAIQEIRQLCQRLVAPLKNINLEELIIELLAILSQRSVVKTYLSYVVSDKPLSDDIKLNLYRIVQEHVNNILKYAEATNVSVTLKTVNETIHLTITDDGKGYDVEKNRTGIGISNMVNRVTSFNGEIEFISAIGEGCRTQISIPY